MTPQVPSDHDPSAFDCVAQELEKANEHLDGIEGTVQAMVTALNESLASTLSEDSEHRLPEDVLMLREMIEDFTQGFSEGMVEILSSMNGGPENTLQEVEDLREARIFNEDVLDVLERIASNTDPDRKSYGISRKSRGGVGVSGSGSGSESSGLLGTGGGAALGAAGGIGAAKLLSKVSPKAALKWVGTRAPMMMVTHFAVAEALESAGKAMRGEDASNRISNMYDSIIEAIGSEDLNAKFFDKIFGAGDALGGLTVSMWEKFGLIKKREEEPEPDSEQELLDMKYSETRDAILASNSGDTEALSRTFEIDDEMEKREGELQKLNTLVETDRAYAEEYYKDIQMHEERLLVLQKERRELALSILELSESDVSEKAREIAEREKQLEIERSRLESLRGFMGFGRKFSDKQIDGMLEPQTSELESLREEISLDDKHALVQMLQPEVYANASPRVPEPSSPEVSPVTGTGVEGNAEEALLASLSERGITDPQKVANIFAQVEAESNFKPQSENMNYSGRRLYDVFGSRYFSSVQEAEELAAQGPEAIANYVYSDNGPRSSKLGNTEEGDGHRFRGRGMIQLTGRDNYERYSDLLGIDLVSNPDLANDPNVAAQIAAEYFSQAEKRGTDLSSISDVTRAVGAATQDSGNRERLSREWLSSLERADEVPSLAMADALNSEVSEAAALSAEREFDASRGSGSRSTVAATTITNNNTNTSVVRSTPVSAVPMNSSRDVIYSPS